MSQKLYQDAISVTGRFFESNFECPVECEILLADYDEQVFKILKTNVEGIITQKYIQEDKLTIEGFFKITVYYRPPGAAHITTVSKKLPFQRQFDLPESVKVPYFILTGGDTQYVNTRAVNSRRIEIRGVYAMGVKLYTITPVPVATAVNSETVCCDSREIKHFYLSGRGSRQFSVEDELPQVEDMDRILNITYRSNNMSSTAYADKVNVKGEILADIAYTVKDRPGVMHLMKTFVYNQVVDVPGSAESSMPFANLSLISFTVTQNPDTKGINCIVTSLLEVRSFAKSRVIGVKDAFSKEYEYTKELKTLEYDENITAVNRIFRLSIEDTVPEGYTNTYCIANITPPAYDGKGNIKSKLTVNVIAQNAQNEFECVSKTQDISLDIGEKAEAGNEYLLSCNVNNAASSVSGDSIKVQLSIALSGFVIRKNIATVLSRFAEDEEKPVDRGEEGLVLYYAQKGERVFDIAMQYKTDVKLIERENSLEQKVIEQEQMLIIPAFGM